METVESLGSPDRESRDDRRWRQAITTDMTEPSVVWSTREWAAAIARLPAPGPLPCRTVLVPREPVAHALRRAMIRGGHAAALAGTRFVTPVAAAVAVLDAAGISFTPGEAALRPARLLALFRRGVELEHFPLDLLRSNPGWDDAFARTLLDLEAAGLRPDDVERAQDSARLRDVARIWRALDASAGGSWTAGRILLEAAAVLEARPAVWPFAGGVLAAIAPRVTGAEVRFTRALPRATLVLLAARPLRSHHLGRMRALLGEDAARVLVAAEAPRAASSERDLLTSYLFEPPRVLADPARPRSAGPDGTVDLEEHAGVDAELEATADWVARQVMDGAALEEIAVLLPSRDPFAGLVSDRLARLPWQDGALPVHVAGGLPLASTAGGARALAVVRALRAHLAGDALVEALQGLRLDGDASHRLSAGDATDLVWSLGVVGGNPARPEGALEWASRALEREAELAAQLAALRVDGEDAEAAGHQRRGREIEHRLEALAAVRPVLAELAAVGRLVVEGAALGTTWPALRGFLETRLLQPGAGPRVHALLDAALGPAAADAACGTLTGDDALRVIEATLRSIRVPSGRFGEPAVYIGTLAGAAGLSFRAVRLLDLAEGHLPGAAREDPVVPDHVRARLSSAAGGRPVTAADRVLADLHALDIVLRNAEARVALSVPRLDLDRSQREPSSVVLEAAVALARPNAVTGAAGAVVPDAHDLQRDAFGPARRAAIDARRRAPLGEAAWLDGVAARSLGVPARWRGSGALDLARVAALRDQTALGALDGVLGAAAAGVEVPGLTPDRPISPSALQTLLQCPHLYLLRYLLGFWEPAAAPPQREIGQPYYGSLLHAAAERFYRAHGAAFCAGQDTFDDWRARADRILEQVFDEFAAGYPLAGRVVRQRERERVREDLASLLAYEWRRPARRLVGAERVFGRPTPVELSAGDRSLFVRGQIDRLEAVGDRTVIVDLKTARGKPRAGREAAAQPVLDVQIAVYGLVAQRLAREWQSPPRVGAAYVYVNRGVEERNWRDDFHEALEPAARAWLQLAADLLAGRVFPRTPLASDCRYCSFRPVCGEGVHERVARLLPAGRGILARFGALKTEPEEED